jgi:hypothetical protein
VSAFGRPLWTPLDDDDIIGWLDVNNGVSIDGSDLWQGWDPQKGNFGVDPFSDSEPSLGAINNLPAWSCGQSKNFDEDASNGGDWLTFTNAAADVWVFTVIQPGSADAANRTFLNVSTGTSTSSGRLAMIIDDSGAAAPNALQIGGRILDADSYAATIGSTDLVTDSRTTYVVAGRWSPANDTVEAWVDDVKEDEDTTWQGSGSAFDTTDSLDLSLGLSATPTQTIVGMDVIIAAGDSNFMTTKKRQRIFAFLAHKAGISNQLPASNPYKTQPVTK